MPEKDKNLVFGPVPSRRLGRSLGVDLVPFKTCSFNCIYCQLGPSPETTLQRQAFVNPEEAAAAVEKRLSETALPDYITLSGSGEPTLCLGLDRIIGRIKSITDIPVAVLTNGSLFHLPELRNELMAADLVIPSLDAGSENIFQHINRPCPGLDFNRFVQGLIDFGHEFKSRLWLEVFILNGINSVEADVRRIAGYAERINPEKVQLNTVARPPAEDYAMAVPPDMLEKISGMFNLPTEIIADYSGVHDKEEFTSSRDDVLHLLERRPCTVEQIASGLGIHRNEVVKHVGELVREGIIQTRQTGEGCFYSGTEL